MSKKSNTIIFMLGATMFNILVTVLSFIILFIVYSQLIAPHIPQENAAIGLPVIFIGAILLSFLIYRTVLKYIMKKIDVEKHFDPLFKPRRKK